jgi:hypothetical protein
MAAAFAVFFHVLLLAINAVALPHRGLLLPLRRRRLLHDGAAILMVLGTSAIFHAVAAGPNDDDTDASRALAAAAGFVIWVAAVVLLLLDLTAGRFPGPGAAAAAAAAPARVSRISSCKQRSGPCSSRRTLQLPTHAYEQLLPVPVTYTCPVALLNLIKPVSSSLCIVLLLLVAIKISLVPSPCIAIVRVYKHLKLANCLDSMYYYSSSDLYVIVML